MTTQVTRRSLILTAAALAATRSLPAAAHDGTPHAGTPMAGMDDGHGHGDGHGDGPMGGTGAAFMIISNAGAEPDRLLSAAGDAAETYEIHEMADEGGTMVMRPLADGLEIPAGGAVELKPGGYHVMLIGLAKDLEEGGSHDLTLTFEKAGEVVVPVAVMTAQDAAMMASAPVEAGDIDIDFAWSRPAPALGGMVMGMGMATPEAGMDMDMDMDMGHDGGTGAAFMTIANAGAEPDRLAAGSTPAARTVEIHEMFDDAGTMTMRPLADGLEIPAGGSVELRPGGYHVMLIGLTQDLQQGEVYELTLVFEKAGEVKLEVPVIRQDEAAAMAGAPVAAGDLTIDKAWSRPAPALMGMDGQHGDEEGAGMEMHSDAAATPAP